MGEARRGPLEAKIDKRCHNRSAMTVDFDQIQWASTRGPIDA